VRQATAAYHDWDKAAAAGYELDPVCISNPGVGTMGIHAINRPLFAAQLGVVADQPEALLYVPKAGGGLKLVAVEYLEPVILDFGDGKVGPWFEQGPWPTGAVIVNPHPELFGVKFDGPMPGHGLGMPWHWDLHVWAWQPNPSGLFEQWNPSISCTP